MNYNIDYEIIGGKGLLASSHIADILSVLRIIYNHSDEIAWLTYLRLWKIPNAEKYCTEFAKMSFSEVCNKLNSIGKKAERAVKLLQIASGLRFSLNEMLSTVIRSLFGRLQYKYEKISNRNRASLTWDERRRDFIYLEKLAYRCVNLNEFVELYGFGVKKRKTKSEDKILIITAHSAKGTEYPVCYIAGANPMNYPSLYFSRGVLENIEEERRVLYVALTRAKDELIITRSINVLAEYTKDEMQNAEKNYLLQNVPKNLVEEYVH